MRGRSLLALVVLFSSAGCGGGRVHVGPMLEAYDRYEKDLRLLEAGGSAEAPFQEARTLRQEAQTRLQEGDERSAHRIMTEALAGMNVALAATRQEAAFRRSDQCLREAESARSLWEEALFELEQTETFLDRKTDVERDAPEILQRNDPPLPPTALDLSPASVMDGGDLAARWDSWRSVAGSGKVGAADLEERFHRNLEGASGDAPEEEKALHLRLAVRALQELELRVRQERAERVCLDALRLTHQLGEGRDRIHAAGLELERSLQDALRNELDRTRAEAKNRQTDLYEALTQLEGKFARITQSARGTIVSLADVLFDFDKSTLRRDVEFNLVKVATILNQFEEMTIVVEGHTDNIGTDEYNLDLSKRRAEAVYDFLVSQGVTAERMTNDGFGESRPVADNGTDEGRQRNRRVDLVIQEGL